MYIHTYKYKYMYERIYVCLTTMTKHNSTSLLKTKKKKYVTLCSYVSHKIEILLVLT